VAVLVFISAGAGICGTYLCGALSNLGYNRLMVHTSQKVVSEIRMEVVEAAVNRNCKSCDCQAACTDSG